MHLKKLLQRLREAKPGQVVVMDPVRWFWHKIKVMVAAALWVVCSLTWAGELRKEPVAGPLNLSQKPACTLPREEAQLTVAIMWKSELLCWVMK